MTKNFKHFYNAPRSNASFKEVTIFSFVLSLALGLFNCQLDIVMYVLMSIQCG